MSLLPPPLTCQEKRLQERASSRRAIPGVGWLGSPLEQTDGWAQASSSPHLCLSFTLLCFLRLSEAL